jgi:IS30 family transposase
MKDGKTQAQIVTLMNRHKSTISQELAHNTGLKGYHLTSACWQKPLGAAALPKET